MDRLASCRIAWLSNHDIDLIAERTQKPHKPLNRDIPEVAPKHAGDVGLADPHQLPRLALRETTLVDHILDTTDETRLEQVSVSVDKAQIGEDICRSTTDRFLLRFHLLLPSRQIVIGRRLEPPLDQLNLVLRRLAALFRFLLESV